MAVKVKKAAKFSRRKKDEYGSYFFHLMKTVQIVYFIYVNEILLQVG